MADRDNKQRAIAISQIITQPTDAGERQGTEIAKGQSGRPVVGAHLSCRLCTCTLTCTNAHGCIIDRLLSLHGVTWRVAAVMW